jgi:hypothetical protein
MKKSINGYFFKLLLGIFMMAAVIVMVHCGGGGGGGDSDADDNGSTDTPTSTFLQSADILPDDGGILSISHTDEQLNGATIKVLPNSISKTETLSIYFVDSVPAATPYGETPVSTLFKLEPTGLNFTKDATLSLPISSAQATAGVYIGRWDESEKKWDNLGGTVDGDYISTDIDHLSLYGIFYTGKSTVQIVNNAALADLGIKLAYVNGPVIEPNIDLSDEYFHYPPLPSSGLELELGQSSTMRLLPGRYHFLVSYPHPQPGVANSLFFTIPVLAEETGFLTIDQTISIEMNGATSTDVFTDNSIFFVGAQDIPDTNHRPTVSCDALVPEDVSIVNGDPNAAGLPSRVVNIGPIKVEQLNSIDITLFATATDPEGESPVYIYWTRADTVLPVSRTVQSGEGVERPMEFQHHRSGIHTTFLTVYDEHGLFDECRWNVEVVPNRLPTIGLRANDDTLDFGRRDVRRGSADALLPLPDAIPGSADPEEGLNGLNPINFPPIPARGLCEYTLDLNPDANNLLDTTMLRSLPTDQLNHIDPTQYPDAMTCLFAIVADADGDPLTAGYRIPSPMFGDGNIYAAIPVPDENSGGTSITLPDGRTVAEILPNGLMAGSIIDSFDKIDAYNATLSNLANAGLLPVQVPSVLSEFPTPPVDPIDDWYLIAFDQGIRKFEIGQTITVNEFTGTVSRIELIAGSWNYGDATGYLWLHSVTGAFPVDTMIRINGTQMARVSDIGQALPVIWEAPDDPDTQQTTHDRRHVDASAIPNGGSTNIEARVTDGFSREKRGFVPIWYPVPLPVGNIIGVAAFAAGLNGVFAVAEADGTTTETRSLNLFIPVRPSEIEVAAGLSGNTLTYQFAGEASDGYHQANMTVNFTDATLANIRNFTANQVVYRSQGGDVYWQQSLSGSKEIPQDLSGSTEKRKSYKVTGEETCSYIASMEKYFNYSTWTDELQTWTCDADSSLEIAITYE